LGTQKEGVNFEPVWKDFEDAVKSLSYEDDRKISERAIDILSKSG
jgi:hypothetical protein